MIRAFYGPGYQQQKTQDAFLLEGAENIVWVDLQNPTPDELRSAEARFGIVFPTLSEQEEIETSSRYFEEEGRIKINSSFLEWRPETGKLTEDNISFILSDNRLFTLRFCESRVLAETVKRIKLQPEAFSSPAKILMAVIEVRIDSDADFIETVSRNIAALGREINYDKELDKTAIVKINEYQEQNMLLREVLFDKQRVVSALQRNKWMQEENGELLRVVIKDINSLIEHTHFNFTRLEYIQNNFMGLINIEQNKIIKLFTVASVVFMPPTLIASVYGMNFKYMPELEWPYAYPLALLLIIGSSFGTLFFFKTKKWL